MQRFLLISGLILLFAAEITRVYLIMPFPGSQQHNTVELAYWIANHIIWIRVFALALIVFPLTAIFRSEKKPQKIILLVTLLVYSVLFYLFNYRFQADKMFYQPEHKSFISSKADTSSRNHLVLGVVINGEAKAYPVQILGYHHQVIDTVGNIPVMVTYCTVCRTGRVFSPFVNGKRMKFRLVGMDHFNAMFEDESTGSWWQQATGKAIAGQLKGQSLKEIPSTQLTLGSWLMQFPNSRIMQPDPLFKKNYADLEGYDKGTIKSSLLKRDSGSWKAKSWVIGVSYNHSSKAYDWNTLIKAGIINDSISGLPVLVIMENDQQSFHIYKRFVKGHELKFEKSDSSSLVDQTTHSVWNTAGLCVAGILNGEKLDQVQAYQEFWHSWSTFHPNTDKYN